MYVITRCILSGHRPISSTFNTGHTWAVFFFFFVWRGVGLWMSVEYGPSRLRLLDLGVWRECTMAGALSTTYGSTNTPRWTRGS